MQERDVPKVLLVEDDLVLSKVAATQLSRIPVDVVIALNGNEAIERFQEQHYDLIIMDVAMPFKDGLEAAREIREIEAATGKHVPIVAISAMDTRDQCLSAGMDDYVIKPADYATVAKKWLPDGVGRKS